MIRPAGLCFIQNFSSLNYENDLKCFSANKFSSMSLCVSFHKCLYVLYCYVWRTYSNFYCYLKTGIDGCLTIMWATNDNSVAKKTIHSKISLINIHDGDTTKSCIEKWINLSFLSSIFGRQDKVVKLLKFSKRL